LPDLKARTTFIKKLKDQDVQAIFHYVPLHSSPAGKQYCRANSDLLITESVSDRLVRLPLWIGMTDQDIDRVIDACQAALREII
jgi:dTDP-4-amino-4,6-dideoxygalactose transaminase